MAEDGGFADGHEPAGNLFELPEGEKVMVSTELRRKISGRK